MLQRKFSHACVDSKGTNDGDVDSVAPLPVSALTPILSAVRGINGLHGTDGRCCRLPVSDAFAHFSLEFPKHPPSSGAVTVTPEGDGAVVKELQSGWDDPS